MLHLIQSNKMEVLAEQLLQLMMATAEQGSLFEEDVILVQSPGMAQWLKLQIAEQSGLAANVSFPLPSSFIWELYRQHVPDLPAESAFTKANMSWKLMQLLPGLLHLPEFASIAGYLRDNLPLKVYQLCHKIADIYDQYLVYRPDWILQWEQGQNQLNDTDVSQQPWQPILWRALVAYSQELGESVWHRANLHSRLITALGQINADKSQVKPLFVFGLSAMPIQQLEVLAALTQSRDVVIFWFNPSAQYWGDIVDAKTLAKLQLKFMQGRVVTGKLPPPDTEHDNISPQKAVLEEYLTLGNPLLASWGKLGRDYQDLLVSLEIGQFDAFVDYQPDSLLSHIQHEILQLTYRGSSQALSPDELLSNGKAYPKIVIAENDRSIQVHSCHSKLRELEVLHDQLLYCFANDLQLSPGDIIVMMPDVAEYAPIIDGVFGGADSRLRIPYAISDRNVAQESPLLNSFMQLMSLQHSRLTLSDVLTLCEVPAIQRKFAISEAEFEVLSHWLSAAGVRWGWDAADKQRWNVPAERQNTWLFGLQRMLAGYAMGQSNLFHSALGDIAPFVEIEGQQAAALGKFYLFSQVLGDALLFCQQTLSLQDKVIYAQSLLERLYEPDEQEQQYLLQLRQALQQIASHQHQYPAPVEQDVFASELQQNLTDKGVGQRFLAGYLNFCTLMPMRSIPFKMVCVLGLNDTDYPRQVVPLGFDLMRVARQRKGDRSRRLDDRYLFLEAILSARQMLYLSYQGRSAKDNSACSASLLLNELLDYCCHCFIVSGDQALSAQHAEQRLLAKLSCQHPLQPFADAYFVSPATDQQSSADYADLLPSFQQHWLHVAQRQRLPVAPKIFSPAQALPATQIEDQEYELNLEQLIRFMHNPQKGFFQARWHSRFTETGDSQQEQEPFSLDGLSRYQLNQRWILDDVDEQALRQEWLAQLHAEGQLPLANSGPLTLDSLSAGYAELKQRISEVTANRRPHAVQVAQQFELNGATLNFQSRINACFDRHLILWRPGSLRAKDRISLWLNWLALCALAPEHHWQSAWFIAKDKTLHLSAIAASEAKVCLQRWLELWLQGQTYPLPFFAETSWTWASTQDVAKTQACWQGGYMLRGEGQELHVARVFPDLAQVFAPMCALADSLLLPLINNENASAQSTQGAQ